MQRQFLQIAQYILGNAKKKIKKKIWAVNICLNIKHQFFLLLLITLECCCISQNFADLWIQWQANFSPGEMAATDNKLATLVQCINISVPRAPLDLSSAFKATSRDMTKAS